MANRIIVEEFHLTVHAPRKLSVVEYRKIRRTLLGVRFRDALGRAMEEVVRRYPSLDRTRLTLTR